MDMNWITVVATILSLGIGAGLIYLIRKQVITLDFLTHAGYALDEVQIQGSGFIATLAEYARLAVRAVEQLAKIGAIPKDNETKKSAAIDYVQHLAKVDEVSLSPADLETADMLIEAAVNELPRNQPKKEPEKPPENE